MGWAAAEREGERKERESFIRNDKALSFFSREKKKRGIALLGIIKLSLSLFSLSLSGRPHVRNYKALSLSSLSISQRPTPRLTLERERERALLGTTVHNCLVRATVTFTTDTKNLALRLVEAEGPGLGIPSIGADGRCPDFHFETRRSGIGECAGERVRERRERERERETTRLPRP